VQDLNTGAEVDGFTLGARVHAGGQGKLFRVTGRGSDRALIMKMPRTGGDEPSESLVAFETEAMVIPAVTGPHVPEFVAAGDLLRTPYLVTEWVEGPTLEAMLEEGPLVPA